MGKPSVTRNSKNERLKKGYPTLNQKVAKIKKGYVTKGGKWQLCFSGGLEFTYSGDYSLAGDPSGIWELALLSDGKLNFSSLNYDSVDIFLVGAGQSGKGGNYDSSVSVDYGGGGGDSGKYKTVSGVAVSESVEYPAVIGKPAKTIQTLGSDSEIFGQTSAGGLFTAGTPNPGRDGNRSGAHGILAFNGEDCLNFPERRFAAGGAASGSFDYINWIAYPSDGINPKGGNTGGGNGGIGYTNGVYGGTNASANTGSGGGGGGMGGGNGKYGYGGSGIILIRPHIA